MQDANKVTHQPGDARRQSQPRTRLFFALLFTVLTIFMAACSTAVVEPTAEAGKHLVLFEAEDAASVSDRLTAASADNASAGQVLVQLATVPSVPGPVEDAYIEFHVSSAGDYFLWARVRADSYSSDAMYVGIDDQMERIFPDELATFVWLPVSFGALATGSHKVSIGHAEAEAMLDAVVVTNRTDIDAAALDEWVA